MKLINANNYDFKVNEIVNYNKNDKAFKPFGLWYAPENIWLIWSKNFRGDYDKFYEIKLKYTNFSNPNPNKVLRIKNEKDFLDLTFKYGHLEKIPKIADYIMINWQEMAKDFGGIEVIPYIKKLQEIKDPKLIKKFKNKNWDLDESPDVLSITWLDPFDVSSGCVWRPEAVKSFKQIDKKEIMELWEKEKEKHVRYLMERLKKRYECKTRKGSFANKVGGGISDKEIEIIKKNKLMSQEIIDFLEKTKNNYSDIKLITVHRRAQQAVNDFLKKKSIC